jgi:hypothetical protein
LVRILHTQLSFTGPNILSICFFPVLMCLFLVLINCVVSNLKTL